MVSHQSIKEFNHKCVSLSRYVHVHTHRQKDNPVYAYVYVYVLLVSVPLGWPCADTEAEQWWCFQPWLLAQRWESHKGSPGTHRDNKITKQNICRLLALGAKKNKWSNWQRADRLPCRSSYCWPWWGFGSSSKCTLPTSRLPKVQRWQVAWLN